MKFFHLPVSQSQLKVGIAPPTAAQSWMSGTALGENKMAIPKREESYNEKY
jgi:hypothetical protein